MKPSWWELPAWMLPSLLFMALLIYTMWAWSMDVPVTR